MEYIDILDQDGNPTGDVKDRATVHREGLWHRTSRGWIMNNSRELLIHRRGLKAEVDAGLWTTSFSGHIAAGEDSRSAAQKEAGEELGIFLAPEELQFLFSYSFHTVRSDNAFIHNSYHDVYLTEKDLVLESIQYSKEAVAEIRWIRPSSLHHELEERPNDFFIPPPEILGLFDHLRREQLFV